LPVGGAMIVDYYRDHRIEVNAVRADERAITPR
jgi:hypothetical protein